MKRSSSSGPIARAGRVYGLAKTKLKRRLGIHGGSHLLRKLGDVALPYLDPRMSVAEYSNRFRTIFLDTDSRISNPLKVKQPSLKVVTNMHGAFGRCRFFMCRLTRQRFKQ